MVIFDSRYECEVEMNDEAEWEQVDGGHLPMEVVHEIGARIEEFNG
jgi:hypothetical protein